jgi:hypothetical protein
MAGFVMAQYNAEEDFAMEARSRKIGGLSE